MTQWGKTDILIETKAKSGKTDILIERNKGITIATECTQRNYCVKSYRRKPWTKQDKSSSGTKLIARLILNHPLEPRGSRFMLNVHFVGLFYLMAAIVSYYIRVDSIIIKSEKVTQVKELKKLGKFEKQSHRNTSELIGSKGYLESREIAGANKG